MHTLSNALGWVFGVVAIILFSGSLPAMWLALDGFNPWFVASGRAAIAACGSAIVLVSISSPRPVLWDLPSLFVLSATVVFGFPLLSAMALQEINATRAIAWMGLMPIAIAMFAMLRIGETVRFGFWIWLIFGAAVLFVYSVWHGGRSELTGDTLMGSAVILCAIGYAEGGRLARRLGGWQVICWGLLLSLPVSLALCILNAPPLWSDVSVSAWIGLGYAAVFSMLIGMILWYRASEMAGTSAIGLLQLSHPFIGILMMRIIEPEPLPKGLFLALLLVAVCVLRARQYIIASSPMVLKEV